VSSTNFASPQEKRPALLARSIALMKPITWFAAMWAFLCGAVASGEFGLNLGDILRLSIGMVMAGPLLCGASQVINDYFDREIDAINEPDRLIPSGMVSTGQIVATTFVLLIAGFAIALFLGRSVALLTAFGVLLAIAYSAPPIRAKRNGWAGNTLVAISYEGLAWLAGHLAFGPLTTGSLLIALVYSFGTHGIMSINDYKSIDGDRKAGIRTIPVQYGPHKAAWLILLTMNFAQFVVVGYFILQGSVITSAVIVGIILVQLPVQRQFIKDPEENYLKFSAIGVSFFVWGMLAAAFGLSAL